MDDGAPPIPPRPPGYEVLVPLQSPATEAAAAAAAAPPPLPPRRASSTQQWSPSPPLPPRQASSSSAQFSPPPPPPPPVQFSPPPPPPPPPGPPPPLQPAPDATPWSHLLYSNGEPTPLFTALMNDFFTVLDEHNTGSLTPEVFSGFLELNGFTRDEDPWRNSHTPLALPFLPIDNADFTLLSVYQSHQFPHLISPTPRSPHRPVLPYGGVPLLLREGFVSYLAIEFSNDAPARCRGLNLALRRYGAVMPCTWEGRRTWREMGAVPEWCFMRDMPPEVKRKVDEAGQRGERLAREKVEAVRVENEIKAIGRRNAEELVGDYRYVYRYEY